MTIAKHKPVTGDELRRRRLAMGWTVNRTAAEIGVLPQTYRRWELGDLNVPYWMPPMILGFEVRERDAKKQRNVRIHRELKAAAVAAGRPIPYQVRKLAFCPVCITYRGIVGEGLSLEHAAEIAVEVAASATPHALEIVGDEVLGTLEIGTQRRIGREWRRMAALLDGLGD